jgi:ubiquinone/menaquinone biosynthesis C-methylase UbiE
MDAATGHDDAGECLSVQAGYDRWADSYDDVDPSTLLDEPALRPWAVGWAGCRVLDLGCGTGRYARLLAAAGARIVGVDLSAGMLEQARQRGPASAAWARADVRQLPFRNAAFAGVVSGLVVDHVPDLRPLLAETARVLASGGRAIFVGVHPDSQRRRGPHVAFHRDGKWWRMPGSIHTPPQWRQAARQTPLSIECMRTLHVNQRIIDRHPHWRPRLGEPALLMLVAAKR